MMNGLFSDLLTQGAPVCVATSGFELTVLDPIYLHLNGVGRVTRVYGLDYRGDAIGDCADEQDQRHEQQQRKDDLPGRALSK
jgi:hypothetical protein